ncbi:MAG: thiamine biosynthesis protein ThiF [Anaerolinea sp.]|nr:thiamine biosynthesis protein ThiF [Anaerolinea sp.]
MPESDLGVLDKFVVADPFSYVNALKLILPAENKINLLMVGCGGTGSWLAPAVARVGKILIERFSREIEIAFFDPDTVEEKNIYRQNFCAAEIGKNKASALAERYGQAWGIEIGAVNQTFKELDRRFYGSMAFIIGCVDNAKARQSISKCIQGGVAWLDCGNTKSYGQVLLGAGQCSGSKDPFMLPGFCGWLPYPHQQHPELIGKSELANNGTPAHSLQEIAGRNPVVTDGISCAEMAMQDSQGLAINQRMAAEAADYLVRILITHDLRKFATYIDLESGSCTSRYITEKEIREFAK